jgi:hypothetical protein
VEIVHHNVPSIKILCLKDTNIVSGEIPQYVVPASSITEINMELFGVGNLSTHIQFYKYIGMKYPSVSKPTFDDRTIRASENDYFKDVYSEGIIPCHQNIGSQIDAFLFQRYFEAMDAFRKFDRSGIKLKELGMNSLFGNHSLILGELAQSQQSQGQVFQNCQYCILVVCSLVI